MATATPFCPRRAAKGHEGPRRTTKNGNGNTLLSTKGREGPRRTATATPFCPRRAANGNTLFVHDGPRRTTKKTLNPFIHEGALGVLIHATIQAEGSGLRLTQPASNDDGGWLRRGFWRGALRGVSNCSGQWSVVSGQWSVVSGWRQVRRWREGFWRGALRGVSPRTREGRRPDRQERA